MTAKPEPPYLLGIDIGTTNLKANLYDVHGRRVAAASRPTVARHPHSGNPGWAVYSADDLWRDTVANIRRITSQVTHPEAIAALAIAGMGEPIIPLDRNGDWLHPAICWFDRRTEPQARWWREQFGARRIYAITGQPVSFLLSLNAMLWIREHEPEVFRQARRWLVVEDYLGYRLTGACATDYSIASRTMGFDIVRKRWSDEIFAAAGLDPGAMPDPQPSGMPIGRLRPEVAELTGLAPGTILATGGHDHGCASLPARVQRPDSILNSTGTCDVMLGVLDAPLLSDAAYEAAVPVYPHPLPGKYQVMDSILFGASALDWYLDRFGAEFGAAAHRTGGNVYDLLLESAARAAPRARGLFWLPNARGVPTDPAARGAFVGIRDSHTGSDFVRALVEGICYEIRLHIDTFERLFGTAVKRMVVVGGTSRSAFFTQLRADVTGRVVEVLDTEEATSLGAAMLAGMAAGVYADYADAAAQAHRVRRVFEPDRDRREQYDHCYRKVYRRIAGALHGIDSAIAAIFPPQE